MARRGAPFLLRRFLFWREFRIWEFPDSASRSRHNLPAWHSFSGIKSTLPHGSEPLMSAAPVIYVTSFQIGKIYA
jgi:hypothetical protein